MSIEDDKLDQLVDMLDARNEPTDEELAQRVQKAAREMERQGIVVPFDADKEWEEVASRLDIAEEKRSPRLHMAIYAVAGIAAMLLIVFGIRFLLPSSTDSSTSFAYTRIANTPKTVVMKAGNKQVVVEGDSQNIAVATMPRAQRSMVMQALGYETDNVPTERYTISIPSGKSYSITLADGTQVFLYAGSHLTYPSQFIGDERNVYLQGEAYFKVAKDASKPFVITTDNAEARVLGTELNVSCYDGASSHVALINGSVEVKPKSSAKAVRLQPGQGATISGNESVAVAAEDMEGYEQWLNGYIYFDDATLRDIALAIGRWYNVNVSFDDKSLETLKFRFFCRRDESLRRTLDLLNSFDSFSASFEGETLKIGRK